MKDFNSMSIKDLLIESKGKSWIIGREAESFSARDTDDETLCIRMTEKDRKEIIQALIFYDGMVS